MPGVMIETMKMGLEKVFATNSVLATIPVLVPTVVDPKGDGIFKLKGSSGSAGPSAPNVAVCFYGTTTNNQTFLAKISGWSCIGNLWVPVPLLALSGILGTAVGNDGNADVAEANLFADTLTVATQFSPAPFVVNPVDNSVAWAFLDLLGCDRMQIQFSTNGSSVSLNALARSL
jgi:hypothetical protein